MPSADVLARSEKQKLTRLGRDLLEWARENRRAMPWREPGATTYQKIAVEVLLQRTTATAVAEFYAAFFSRFRTWVELAGATPGELEKVLMPLGLWRRRANSLLGLANYAAKVGGQFPADPASHRNIPAVGQYVSNAILLFQHGRPAPLLDGNMARVIERFVRPRRLADIRHDPWLQAAAHWLVRGPSPEQVNWAILDFAALICNPRTPLCGACPVQRRCAFARAEKVQPTGR